VVAVANNHSSSHAVLWNSISHNTETGYLYLDREIFPWG